MAPKVAKELRKVANKPGEMQLFLHTQTDGADEVRPEQTGDSIPFRMRDLAEMQVGLYSFRASSPQHVTPR